MQPSPTKLHISVTPACTLPRRGLPQYAICEGAAPTQPIPSPPCPSCPRAVPARRLGLFYHQQAMTWGWYMLEPWETVLWMSLLGFLCWLVLSACFLNPNSICSSTLTAVRKALAAQGEPAGRWLEWRSCPAFLLKWVLGGNLLRVAGVAMLERTFFRHAFATVGCRPTVTLQGPLACKQ